MAIPQVFEAAPFIADADSGQVTISSSIDLNVVEQALTVQTELELHDVPRQLKRGARDARSIAEQGWMVIYPDTPRGQEMIAQLEPLLQLRQIDRQRYLIPYNPDCSPAMPLRPEAAAAAWIAKQKRRWEDDERLERLPYYTLIVGDFVDIPLELQHQLSNESAVGRLVFQELGDYNMYAHKCCRYNSELTNSIPHVYTYVVDDGTMATQFGARHIVGPLLEQLRRDCSRGVATRVIEIGYNGGEEMLRSCSARPGSILVSVSHGAGRPRAGWPSTAVMRARQGAPIIRRTGRLPCLLEPHEFAEQPFLPGGLWFYMACFGGGTPGKSAFAPWLNRVLERDATQQELKRLRQQLPLEGEGPFVGTVPQRALANPLGPLAVVAHVDLAWSYGFWDLESDANYVGHLVALVRDALRGEPVGYAFNASFQPRLEDVNGQLLFQVQDWKNELPINKQRFARNFLQRHDLRGYVLFGDPAVSIHVPAPNLMHALP